MTFGEDFCYQKYKCWYRRKCTRKKIDCFGNSISTIFSSLHDWKLRWRDPRHNDKHFEVFFSLTKNISLYFSVKLHNFTSIILFKNLPKKYVTLVIVPKKSNGKQLIQSLWLIARSVTWACDVFFTLTFLLLTEKNYADLLLYSSLQKTHVMFMPPHQFRCRIKYLVDL